MPTVRRSGFRLAALAVLALPRLAPGALVWEAHEVRLAVRSNAREIAATYHFRNAGSTPVAIADVVTGCDCTVIELTQQTYAPGEAGTLTAKQALRAPSGVQEEAIAVFIDGGPAEPVALRLRAEIQPLLAVSPAMLVWPQDTEPAEAVALVEPAGPLPLASVSVVSIHPAGTATARVETVPGGSRYRISVRRPAPLAGPLNLTIACTATFPDGTTQDFVVQGTAPPSGPRSTHHARRPDLQARSLSGPEGASETPSTGSALAPSPSGWRRDE